MCKMIRTRLSPRIHVQICVLEQRREWGWAITVVLGCSLDPTSLLSFLLLAEWYSGRRKGLLLYEITLIEELHNCLNKHFTRSFTGYMLNIIALTNILLIHWLHAQHLLCMTITLVARHFNSVRRTTCTLAAQPNTRFQATCSTVDWEWGCEHRHMLAV